MENNSISDIHPGAYMRNWVPLANVPYLIYFLLTTGTAVSSQAHTPLILSIASYLFQCLNIKWVSPLKESLKQSTS